MEIKIHIRKRFAFYQVLVTAGDIDIDVGAFATRIQAMVFVKNIKVRKVKK